MKKKLEIESSSIAYVGWGSNLGDPYDNIQKCVGKLEIFDQVIQLSVSPLYHTAAVLDFYEDESWNKPYANAVLRIEISQDLSCIEFFKLLQKVQHEVNLDPKVHMAPRKCDLDLLFFSKDKKNSISIQEKDFDSCGLILPHPRWKERAFVLDPLSDLDIIFKDHFLKNANILQKAQEHKLHQPKWIGILNLTPDSFSDGGRYSSPQEVLGLVKTWQDKGIQAIDVGAESTRPGAEVLTSEMEWERLSPFIKLFEECYKDKIIRPILSVDTYHAETFVKLREYSCFDIWNDVSGRLDNEKLKLIKNFNGQYVLMHSLSIPADPKKVLNKNEDPIKVLMDWFLAKFKILNEYGISKSQILIDPGIGFGKTASQSQEIIKRAKELNKLGCGVYWGVSRKSFYKNLGVQGAKDRDFESVGSAIHLSQSGAHYIRVHDPIGHAKALAGYHFVQSDESHCLL